MWILALLACGAGGPADDLDDTQDGRGTGDCADDRPTLAIGGTLTLEDGQQRYATADDGVHVTMVHGPQGGWHVLASARIWNTDPIVAIHYAITVDTLGATISSNDYRVQIVEDEACSGYYPGMYGYLDVTGIASGDADTPPELLAGADLHLWMEIEDTSGRTAADELLAVADLDPADENPDTGG